MRSRHCLAAMTLLEIPLMHKVRLSLCSNRLFVRSPRSSQDTVFISNVVSVTIVE